MASILEVAKKKRVGTTPDGKPIFKPTRKVMLYARVKGLDNKWSQVPTKQTDKRSAQKWAEARCACDACGGPQRLLDAQAKAAAEAAAEAEANARKTFADLAADWKEQLKNRDTVNDKNRLKLHLLPYFGARRIDSIDQSVILDWIDMQRTTKKKRGKGNLSEATIRHNLNLLSRFMGWCVPRHIASNPVAGIAHGKRPQATAQLMGEAPWLDDDKITRDLFRALPEPYALMFYTGNRTGARLGEICGLRLSSFADVDRGIVTIRWTYDNGFLKEDKKREGKSKNAPVPPDLIEMVKAQIERRKAEGATAESLLFPNAKNEGKAYRSLALDRAWIKACEAIGFTKVHPEDVDLPEDERRRVPRCTFYEATRHSFVSRTLRDTRGRALYEVARAVGHADTSMIAKHYARWIIADFSEELRGGLGLETNANGMVLPFQKVAS